MKVRPSPLSFLSVFDLDFYIRIAYGTETGFLSILSNLYVYTGDPN